MSEARDRRLADGRARRARLGLDELPDRPSRPGRPVTPGGTQPQGRYSEQQLRVGLLNREDAGLPWERLVKHNGKLLVCAMAASGVPRDDVRRAVDLIVRVEGGYRAGGSVNMDALLRGALAHVEPEEAARWCGSDLGAEHTGELWRGKKPGTWRLDEVGTLKAYRPWTVFGRLVELAGYQEAALGPESLLRDDLEFERAYCSLFAVEGVVRNLRGNSRRSIVDRGAGLRTFPGDLYSPSTLASTLPLFGMGSSGSMLSELIVDLIRRTGTPTGRMTREQAVTVLERVPFGVDLTVEHYRSGGHASWFVGEVGSSTAALTAFDTGLRGDWTIPPQEVTAKLQKRVELLRCPEGAVASYAHKQDRERESGARARCWLEGRTHHSESAAGHVEMRLRDEADVASVTRLGVLGATHRRAA